MDEWNYMNITFALFSSVIILKMTAFIGNTQNNALAFYSTQLLCYSDNY